MRRVVSSPPMPTPLPQLVLDTLAADCACEVADLTAPRTTVTLFRPMPRRRRFPVSDSMLHAITIGAGTVICVGPAHEQWAREVLAPLPPAAVFSQRGKLEIFGRLAASGRDSYGPSPLYLCDRRARAPVPRPPGLRLEMLEGPAIATLYRHEGLRMALSYYTQGDRPDVLAAAAWDAQNLAGVAACSADSDDMWQVGIDVLPAYRGRGVARWLVHEVTRAILDHEKVPYYSCGLHNLASQRIAFAAGYWPAWTSVESR